MTTLPCLAVLLTTPSVGSIVSEGSRTVVRGLNNSGVLLKPGLTAAQRMLLLGSYIPFFVIPLFIAIDMAYRLRKLSAASWKMRVGKWE
jgi:hypothetical protein